MSGTKKIPENTFPFDENIEEFEVKERKDPECKDKRSFDFEREWPVVEDTEEDFHVQLEKEKLKLQDVEDTERDFNVQLEKEKEKEKLKLQDEMKAEREKRLQRKKDGKASQAKTTSGRKHAEDKK